MREILFRGKAKNRFGEPWVEGYFMEVLGNGTPYIATITPIKDGEEAIIDGEIVLPETVGQYTGLTDKNGKKIFEGDILQFDYTGKNLGVYGTSIVEFDNGKFGVKWGNHKEFVCLDGFANTTVEVIGNIHDNPELLKEGADNDFI